MFFCSIRKYNACFASSCTAKHIFIQKSIVLHLFEGPKLRTHYLEDIEEK